MFLSDCWQDFIWIHLFRICILIACCSLSHHWCLSLSFFYMYATLVYQELLVLEIGYHVKKRICMVWLLQTVGNMTNFYSIQFFLTGFMRDLSKTRVSFGWIFALCLWWCLQVQMNLIWSHKLLIYDMILVRCLTAEVGLN